VPCFHPLLAFQVVGSGAVCFRRPAAAYLDLKLPCGKCEGCQLERARQWAVRMMHEASLYDDNCFVTLTYDEKHLPVGGSLVREHFPLFIRRLRKAIFPRKVRYYHVGEYGTYYGRPHYHALLFGYDFGDKVKWSERGGFTVWRSCELEALWPLGYCELGSVTFDSAAYVARYVVGTDSRGVVGLDADGCVSELEREYSTMSRRPGIGRGWFDKFGGEVYPADGVVVNGVLRKPPRYYDIRLAIESPEVFDGVRCSRMRRIRKVNLEAAEKCAIARLSLKRRELE
jgi:hypothetical protein